MTDTGRYGKHSGQGSMSHNEAIIRAAIEVVRSSHYASASCGNEAVHRLASRSGSEWTLPSHRRLRTFFRSLAALPELRSPLTSRVRPRFLLHNRMRVRRPAVLHCVLTIRDGRWAKEGLLWTRATSEEKR